LKLVFYFFGVALERDEILNHLRTVYNIFKVEPHVVEDWMNLMFKLEFNHILINTFAKTLTLIMVISLTD
jgi:hypothetical protein